MHKPNQLALLKTRRFFPLFCTQFLGAFNDNLFKNALIVLMAYHGINIAGVESHTLVNIAAGIFILPFFLFSATAGQLAEKLDKAELTRYIKLLEVGIMLIASLGFIYHHAVVLLICLFLMGLHSTLFGPIKYAILPQYLKEHELLGGNGMIEMGTFVAILIGQTMGTLLVSSGTIYLLILVVMLLSLAGYFTSRAMPPAPSFAPTLSIDWNFIRGTCSMLREVRKNRVLFLPILAISWFWFYGAVYLTQMPEYSKRILGGGPEVYTLLITLFSIGVAIGSLLCEKLSQGKVELGLVPLASIGLTVFGIDLYYAVTPVEGEISYLSLITFLCQANHYRTMIDFLMLGVSGGIFTVPLYALIQLRAKPHFRSRVIAVNNIMNALFMVIAAGISILLLSMGISIPILLLLVSISNIVVVLYIYCLLPEFTLRFMVWMLCHLIYRIREEGLEHIPDEGPALLICNHVSYVDALIIAGASPRPVRFVIDHRIFNLPILRFIFRTAGTIPIASDKEDSVIKDRAFNRVAQYLDEGEIVCIFPEGRLTPNGDLSLFRSGMETILAQNAVPVIPMALQGLWGSVFSRSGGNRVFKLLKCFWYRVTLTVGKPIAASAATAPLLQLLILELRGNRQ
jgi:1-acyl-sn-glycerol-3-phosphate acyltransferase